MKTIEGGICAAKGFKANGIHCGIRKNKSKRDLSLIVSDVKATAAAVYTTNLVKGAPILSIRSTLPTDMPRLSSATAELPTPATPTELKRRKPWVSSSRMHSA